MSSITIQLPAIEADHTIEIDIKVNGRKVKYHYKVELVSWEECDTNEEKAFCLKRVISDYSKDWQLINIGNPTEKDIPLMFKEKN